MSIRNVNIPVSKLKDRSVIYINSFIFSEYVVYSVDGVNEREEPGHRIKEHLILSKYKGKVGQTVVELE